MKWLSAQPTLHTAVRCVTSQSYLPGLLFCHVTSFLPLVFFLGHVYVSNGAFVIQPPFLTLSQFLCRKQVGSLLNLCLGVLQLLCFSLLNILVRLPARVWQLKEKKLQKNTIKDNSRPSIPPVTSFVSLHFVQRQRESSVFCCPYFTLYFVILSIVADCGWS